MIRNNKILKVIGLIIISLIFFNLIIIIEPRFHNDRPNGINSRDAGDYLAKFSFTGTQLDDYWIIYE